MKRSIQRVRALLALLLAWMPGCQDRQNILDQEKSPYLLQHKDNPIWWQPWGEKALNEAKSSKKPIFLSIGYSACHWCHVMEKESFEDAEVAKVINKHFIAIKVDREERPDVDKIYMDALHQMGQRGGWPLSMFLTPDGLPFYGGTYWPKKQFLQAITGIAKKWKESSHRIDSDAKTFAKALKKSMSEMMKVRQSKAFVARESYLTEVYEHLLKNFDPAFGGFGKAPKFPSTTKLRFLMRLAHHRGNGRMREKADKMVHQTLERQLAGGIYDHVGGGLHRYSTDSRWFLPHFEKMLYDNAVFATTLVEAYQWSKRPLYAQAAKHVLGYVLRSMQDPAGGFYSSEDADSEGSEGLFYLWAKKEIVDNLSAGEVALLQKYYEFNEKGNFEEMNILVLKDPKDVDVVFDEKLMAIKKKLYALREKRIHPHKDKKVITAWNGLMIGALAKASGVFQSEEFKVAAQKAASRYLQQDKLYRRLINGEWKYDAVADDYAYLIEGLLELYQLDSDKKWLTLASKLQDQLDLKLWSDEIQAYYYAPVNDNLYIRTVEFFDNARPNSNSMTILNLLKLYQLTYREDYKERANKLLASFDKAFQQAPHGVMTAMLALDWVIDGPFNVVLVGRGENLEKMRDVLQENFFPSLTLQQATEGESDPLLVDVFRGKKAPNGYVCRDTTCLPPVTTAKALEQLLAQEASRSLSSQEKEITR